jgi:soluble lytic murein transglycosylase-like protein
MGQRSWAVLLLFTIHYSLFTNVYAFCFEEAGETYGINPSLLKSIARIESNLNPKAMNKNQNGSIDIGLMQINSFWIKTLGLDSGKLISDPCYNTMIGAKVLKQCIDRYGYTWEAVGCYNAARSHKRVKYSWKIFNELKWSRGQGVKESRGQKNEEDRHLNPQTLESSSSSLFFKATDKTTSYEPSTISYELKMEAR